MTAILDAPSRMLLASVWAALAGAFFWGIASILLSPCHLAGIPLVVGFISRQSEEVNRRAWLLSGLFALGTLVSIALIGLITGLLGRILGDLGSHATYVAAALFLFFGLYLLGVIPLPSAGPCSLRIQGKGFLTAMLFGLVFGAALGPCAFAFLAPIIGVALQAASRDLAFAVGLFAAFAVGHCLVIMLAGSLSAWVRRYLRWTESSRGLLVVRKACGALVIAAGIYLVARQLA
jgi:cytochrome c-type biogenesis protein